MSLVGTESPSTLLEVLVRWEEAILNIFASNSSRTRASLSEPDPILCPHGTANLDAARVQVPQFILPLAFVFLQGLVRIVTLEEVATERPAGILKKEYLLI